MKNWLNFNFDLLSQSISFIFISFSFCTTEMYKTSKKKLREMSKVLSDIKTVDVSLSNMLSIDN